MSWRSLKSSWICKKINPLDDRYVFCHLDATRIKSFKKAWNQVCKLAGLADFHYHDLRHTYCSNIVITAGRLKEIREMIGHDDLSMTDRYTHLTMMQFQQRQEKLAEPLLER